MTITFPTSKLERIIIIDKEFLSKYEALKESLKGDLFLLMEVEIDNHFQEVAIQERQYVFIAHHFAGW